LLNVLFYFLKISGSFLGGNKRCLIKLFSSLIELFGYFFSVTVNRFAVIGIFPWYYLMDIRFRRVFIWFLEIRYASYLHSENKCKAKYFVSFIAISVYIKFESKSIHYKCFTKRIKKENELDLDNRYFLFFYFLNNFITLHEISKLPFLI
jgi:hypothetical protein